MSNHATKYFTPAQGELAPNPLAMNYAAAAARGANTVLEVQLDVHAVAQEESSGAGSLPRETLPAVGAAAETHDVPSVNAAFTNANTSAQQVAFPFAPVFVQRQAAITGMVPQGGGPLMFLIPPGWPQMPPFAPFNPYTLYSSSAPRGPCAPCGSCAPTCTTTCVATCAMTKPCETGERSETSDAVDFHPPLLTTPQQQHHVLTQPTPQQAHREPCRYHFSSPDPCRYGDNCWYSHNLDDYMAHNRLKHCPNDGCDKMCLVHSKQCKTCHNGMPKKGADSDGNTSKQQQRTNNQ